MIQPGESYPRLKYTWPSLDLHVQDNTIIKVTSPLDSEVTHGHLCVKGRFGFEFVQRRRREE